MKMRTDRGGIFLILCVVFVVMYAMNNRYIYLGPGLAFDQWTKRSVYCRPKEPSVVGPKPLSVVFSTTIAPDKEKTMDIYNMLLKSGDMPLSFDEFHNNLNSVRGIKELYIQLIDEYGEDYKQIFGYNYQEFAQLLGVVY